ncbi:MAG: low molecular weight phosphotyrosine protein phosphatase [Enhydrobacter sp.]|nr:low molecular weight phosphotyrosine protein phosphatase [Enhydrobacter sp.]
MTIGVLFVCTGNICRSPMATGVFRTLARRAGMVDAFTIDSAGTYDGHAGAPASLLAIEAARRRGYDIGDHRARVLTNEDLAKFDLPLAMDLTHLAAMRWMAPRDRQDRPTLLMKFAPEVGIEEISDPYGGPARGYEEALNLIEAACIGLLAGFQSEFKAARSG